MERGRIWAFFEIRKIQIAVARIRKPGCNSEVDGPMLSL